MTTAFENVKWQLCDAIFLAHTRPNTSLVDVSDVAIEGEVHQIYNSTLGPLGFFSRKLAQTEKHTPSTIGNCWHLMLLLSTFGSS